MTALLDLPYATITLDTTSPALSLVAESRVEPPDPLVVVISADEEIGIVRVAFTDAYGTRRPLGFERVGPDALRIEMPTIGMATGGGVLHVEATDTCCNLSVLDWPVYIDRPRPWDVESGILHAYGTEMSNDAAYTVEKTFEHAYDVAASQDRYVDVVSEQTEAWDIEIAIDGSSDG